MATAPELTLRVNESASTAPQDLTTTALTRQHSMYKTPENYFYHTKTHIDEGDIVIVFMASSSRPFESRRVWTEAASILNRPESHFKLL